MRKGILLNILFIIGMTCLVSCNDDNDKALDEGKNTESGDVQETTWIRSLNLLLLPHQKLTNCN
jgi:hypothetical protein